MIELLKKWSNDFCCLIQCSKEDSQFNQLNYSTDMNFDNFGNIFVIDENNHRIKKF